MLRSRPDAKVVNLDKPTVRRCWRCFPRGRSGEVCNVGGDNERSNLELTHMILAAMGKGERTVRWYCENADWWRRIKTGEYLEYYRKQYGIRK